VPLSEALAIAVQVAAAPEFVQFMTELKAAVDGDRSEFTGR
jgi:hypothetical protein